MTNKEILDAVVKRIADVPRLQAFVALLEPYDAALKRISLAAFERLIDNLLAPDKDSAFKAKAILRAEMTSTEWAPIEEEAIADMKALAAEMHVMEATFGAIGEAGVKMLLMLAVGLIIP